MNSEHFEADVCPPELAAGSHLRPGVRVFDFGLPRLGDPPRLKLSSGTIAASQAPTTSAYTPDAYVPRLPWRGPTSVEHECLHAGDSLRGANANVAVVTIPDAILARFESLRCASRQDPKHLARLRRSSDCARATDEVVEFVSSLTRSGVASLEVAGIRAQRADSVTSTRDGDDYLVGIHVDSWYDRSFEMRPYSPSRMCLNLGLGDRCFLFINLTLRQIADVLGVGGTEERKGLEPGRGLGIAFMHAFPLYPVVSLRVAPGEAYLAPTENILHDGTTFGSAHLDLSLTIHGPFCSEEVIHKLAGWRRP